MGLPLRHGHGPPRLSPHSAYLASKVPSMKLGTKMALVASDSLELYTIPMVVHVIHRGRPSAWKRTSATPKSRLPFTP